MQILIIDKVHPLLIEALEKNNHQVVYRPEISFEETLASIASFDGIVVRSKFFIGKKVLQKATNLKFVARAGVGLDIFDLDYAKKRNIKVLNAAGANANAVAEHALGMLLSISANLVRSNNQVKTFVWEREYNRGVEIKGKTIGLIGYGNTGKAFARKLKAFGCTLLSYDKYKDHFGHDVVQELSLIHI